MNAPTWLSQFDVIDLRAESFRRRLLLAVDAGLVAVSALGEAFWEIPSTVQERNGPEHKTSLPPPSEHLQEPPLPASIRPAVVEKSASLEAQDLPLFEHPLEITPEMIEAGRSTLYTFPITRPYDDDMNKAVAEVYRAMVRTRKLGGGSSSKV